MHPSINVGDMTPSTNIDLDWLFSYHAPTPEQLPKYEKLRAAAKAFAAVLLEETPQSADQSSELRHLRLCCFEANASIALEGSFLGPEKKSSGK